MNNFNEMPFGNELLLAMYNTPSKTLSTEQIAEIISTKLSTEEKPVIVDKLMVSAIYSKLGESLDLDLDLRKRLRVAPKADSTKTARVTKADVLNGIFGQLGLTPVVNGEMTDEEYDAETKEVFSKDSTLIESDVNGTEQEVQAVDEVVENVQLGRNVESIYGVNN